ncbi:unnamed protein product [Effrenium voratum]|uniref:Uncharacterized protein n=1 Tax=Effrenium voratum TaxID=2562239 RepID=A0AA36NJK9_9DINO|nr:unnamed protein product [Effrenium voratum]CAJ1409639.1 unnamed protein product [Effrenium voratum]CAJ1455307.1 unnamed protein product [Effrenium voratum]
MYPVKVWMKETSIGPSEQPPTCFSNTLKPAARDDPDEPGLDTGLPVHWSTESLRCGEELQVARATYLVPPLVGDHDAEVQQLVHDLEREQGIEAALRCRLAMLEAEILECREAEREVRCGEQAGSSCLDTEAEASHCELEALCEAVEMFRHDNGQLQEELAVAEARESELSVELCQLHAVSNGFRYQ